jgi:hypothetical protein
MCPRPEAPRSLPRATRTAVRTVPARCAPRTAGPSTALRRMCADQGRRTTVAYPPSPRRHPRDIALINTARPPPSRRHRRSTAPSAPPPPSCVPTASHGRATIPAPSLGSIGPPHAACCSDRLSRRRSRAAATAAAGPRRAPTPTTSLPQLRSPPGPR